MHPPKPFTSEWCAQHPNNPHCNNIIDNLPINNYNYQLILLLFIAIYFIYHKYYIKHKH